MLSTPLKSPKAAIPCVSCGKTRDMEKVRALPYMELYHKNIRKQGGCKRPLDLHKAAPVNLTLTSIQDNSVEFLSFFGGRGKGKLFFSW